MTKTWTRQLCSDRKRRTSGCTVSGLFMRCAWKPSVIAASAKSAAGCHDFFSTNNLASVMKLPTKSNPVAEPEALSWCSLLTRSTGLSGMQPACTISMSTLRAKQLIAASRSPLFSYLQTKNNETESWAVGAADLGVRTRRRWRLAVLTLKRGRGRNAAGARCRRARST